MLIFAVDDERLVLELLLKRIREAEPAAEVRGFGKSSELLSVITDEGLSPDVIFTDIEMPGLSGMELARKIKLLSPETNIIFVTGYSQYAIEAMSLHPSGYLLKPVTSETVRDELDNLRRPLGAVSGCRIRIQTFGNFEVFCDGIPIQFSRSKSKEILAFLVDKQGTSASMAEIAEALWEDGIFDSARRSSLRVYVSDLRKSLSKFGADDIVIKRKNSLMLDKTKVDCDLYRFIDGDLAAINSYAGQYMQSYGWAELTIGYLENRV